MRQAKSGRINWLKVIIYHSGCRWLPFVLLIPSGPRQSARAVIPTIIIQALTGEFIKLGSLEPRRDLNYVSDTVEGFVKAATAPHAVGRVINLGSGRTVSIGELAQMIMQIMGENKEIIADTERLRPETSEVWHLECNNRLAQEILGWRPQVSLEEGLHRTIQ